MLALASLAGLSVALGVDEARVGFEAYKKTYLKAYSTPEEEALRFSYFNATLARIKRGNELNVAAGGSPVFGITFSADWSPEQRGRRRGRAGHADPASGRDAPIHKPKASTHSTTVDWRTKNGGAVTPVKNQVRHTAPAPHPLIPMGSLALRAQTCDHAASPTASPTCHRASAAPAGPSPPQRPSSPPTC